ncbi:MAG: serine O-acetyltransferase [Buchnera aphidicola (Eriosoma harunire)]
MLKMLDVLWDIIVNETEFLLKKEPLLSKLYNKYIFQCNNLKESIINIIADQLSDAIVSHDMLYNICNKSCISHPIIIEHASADLQSIYTHDPSVNSYVIPLLYFKGFHALQAYRIAHYLWNNNQKSLALYLQYQISKLLSVDIHPAAIIGSGVMFDHATGIVIGETVVIDNNVSIFQSVTLGGTGKKMGDRHPKIRSEVVIGAGAKILGNIEIGFASKIGAGSVVLNSIPAYATAVGIPAKIVNIYNKHFYHMTNNHGISSIRPIECTYEQGAGI